jgi:hypothetical protein
MSLRLTLGCRSGGLVSMNDRGTGRGGLIGPDAAGGDGSAWA